MTEDLRGQDHQVQEQQGSEPQQQGGKDPNAWKEKTAGLFQINVGG
ncbi:MAG: hypothetical protein QXW06_00035 [Thermoplasmata archaeon]